MFGGGGSGRAVTHNQRPCQPCAMVTRLIYVGVVHERSASRRRHASFERIARRNHWCQALGRAGKAGDAVESAVRAVLERGNTLTYDLVGESRASKMSAVTTAVLTELEPLLA